MTRDASGRGLCAEHRSVLEEANAVVVVKLGAVSCIIATASELHAEKIFVRTTAKQMGGHEMKRTEALTVSPED